MAEPLVSFAIDLDKWFASPTAGRVSILHGAFEQACQELSLCVRLDFSMPAGYETAFGLYDNAANTIYVNQSLLDGGGIDTLY